MTTTPTQVPTPAPPPAPEPLQYTDGGPYLAEGSFSPRPTSVTVVACVGIVLGALGLIGKPCMLAMLVVKLPVPNPVVDVMKSDSFLRGWTVTSVGTGWLLSLLLLLSSIGSLRLRDWGRAGVLAYAGLALVMTVLSQVVYILAIAPALAPALKQAAEMQPAHFQMSPAASVVVGAVLGLWFPLVILYVFNRRPVKEAFNQGLEPAGARI